MTTYRALFPGYTIGTLNGSVFTATTPVNTGYSSLDYSGPSDSTNRSPNIPVGSIVTWTPDTVNSLSAMYVGSIFAGSTQSYQIPILLYDSQYYELATLGPGTQTVIFTAYASCFLKGTGIATSRGDVSVDELVIGDLVLTLAGVLRPIKWIGRRSYGGRFLGAGSDMMPILFKADSLADSVPKHDLYVSSQHAMLVGDVLMPACALVNGATILRCTDLAQVEYFHVELASHDIILAEGAPTESYVDCDNRGSFENAAEFRALYPDDASARWAFCRNRVESGPILEGARYRLAARAAQILPRGPTGRLQGYVDRASWGEVVGWAVDEADRSVPVDLEILDGETVIARVTANEYRPDVREASISDGRCGFRLTELGLNPLVPHALRVRRPLDGAELVGSPAMLDAAAALDPAVCSAIAASVGAAADSASSPDELDGVIDFLRAQTGRVLQAQADTLRSVNRLRRQLRALVMDERTPDASRDAGSCAVLSHIASLQRLGYAVSFTTAPALEGAVPAAIALQAIGVDCLSARPFGSVEEILARHAGLFDLVYMHRGLVAWSYGALARRHQPQARLVYAVADLHHLRLERQARAEERPELVQAARFYKAAELGAAALADAVVTHSPYEAAVLRRTIPAGKLHVVPWAISPCADGKPFDRRSGVAFVGNFSHEPNQDAAFWLVEEVMPLVWVRDPTLDCFIAGSEMPFGMERLARSGVHIMGHLDDLHTVQGRVRLTTAPLRFGAGIKGKVLHSLAAGVPCVMTPTAAEGLNLPENLLGLVADGAVALAEAIGTYNCDKKAWQTASEGGLELIRSSFSPARVDMLMRRVAGLGEEVAQTSA